MKHLGIFLAVLLLLVPVFAGDIAVTTSAKITTNITAGEDQEIQNITKTEITGAAAVTTSISSEGALEVTTEEGSEEASVEETSAGFEITTRHCSFDIEYKDDGTLLKGSCTFKVPTPCWKVTVVGYDTSEDGTVAIVKLALVKEEKACAQVISTAKVDVNQFFEGKKIEKVKVHWIPKIAKVEPLPEPKPPVVDKELPEDYQEMIEKAKECYQYREEFEKKMKELYIKLDAAKAANDKEAQEEIRKEITELNREAFEKARECRELLQKVKAIRTRIAVQKELKIKVGSAIYKAIDPCRVMERYENAGIDAEAKIKLEEACKRWQEHRECAELGKKIDEEGLTEENIEIARKCGQYLIGFFERHPCVGAYVLKNLKEQIEMNPEIPENVSKKITENFDEKIQVLKQKCEEKLREVENRRIEAKEAREKVREIARALGDIETQKWIVRMDESLTPEEKAEKLKALEEKRKQLIKELFKVKERRVILPAAVTMRIAPGRVHIEDETINATDKEIEIPTPEGNISVEVKHKEVKLRLRRAIVVARIPVIIAGAELMVNNTKIVSPERILERVRAQNATQLELKQENGKVVYEGKAVKVGRLLGFIPVKVQMVVKADAESGNVIHVKRPWWAVLVFG